MSPFASVMLAVHVLLAIGCAIAFWPPVFTDKGGRAHLVAGKVYVALLFLATSTAVLVSALNAMQPADARDPHSGELLARFAADETLYDLHLAFLSYIAIATASAGVAGLRALKAATRRLRGDAVFHVLVGAAGLVLAVLGARLGQLPVVVVGAAGLVLGLFDARIALRTDPAYRLRDHLTGMIASGVGTYSALGVVVANRLVPDFFQGPYGLVVWLIPTLVGLPAILVLRRTTVESLART